MKRYSIYLIAILLIFAVDANAQKKIYGRTATNGGTGACDNIDCTALNEGDECQVTNSSLDRFIYYWDDDSAVSEDNPFVVEPDSRSGDCATLGAWHLIRGHVTKNDTSGASLIRFYEQYSSGNTNYYEITVPSSITANQSFTLGHDRTDTSISGDSNIEEEDTLTVFAIDMSAAGATWTLTLPASDGDGDSFCFTIEDTDGNDLRIDPDGTDQIAGTTTAGDYMYADAAGETLCISDCNSGIWCKKSEIGTWREE